MAANNGGGTCSGRGRGVRPNDLVSFKFEGLADTLAGQTATATGSGSVPSFPSSIDKTFQPYSATFAPTGVSLRAGVNFHC